MFWFHQWFFPAARSSNKLYYKCTAVWCSGVTGWGRNLSTNETNIFLRSRWRPKLNNKKRQDNIATSSTALMWPTKGETCSINELHCLINRARRAWCWRSFIHILYMVQTHEHELPALTCLNFACIWINWELRQARIPPTCPPLKPPTRTQNDSDSPVCTRHQPASQCSSRFGFCCWPLLLDLHRLWNVCVTYAAGFCWVLSFRATSVHIRCVSEA